MNIQRCGVVNFKAKVSELRQGEGYLHSNGGFQYQQGSECIYAKYDEDSKSPQFSIGAGIIEFIKLTNEGVQLILKPGVDDKGKSHKENYEVILTKKDHILTSSEYDSFKKSINRNLDKVSGIVGGLEAQKDK